MRTRHPKVSCWIRLHGWPLVVLGAVLTVLGVLVAGVLGVWDRWTGEVIDRASWLGAASTLSSALVAALVALYVLGRQRKQQEDRDRDNRRAEDERHREAREIDAAAALAAYIGSAWHIADSGRDLRDELHRFTLPPNAISELHRLLAVWVSHLDEDSLRRVPAGPSDVVHAVWKFGNHVHAGVGNWRDVPARQIFEGMQVDVFEDVRTCHDVLQDVGRQVVMMPWWGPEYRADTLREWLVQARALPLHLPFVGTRSDRLSDDV